MVGGGMENEGRRLGGGSEVERIEEVCFGNLEEENCVSPKSFLR